MLCACHAQRRSPTSASAQCRNPTKPTREKMNSLLIAVAGIAIVVALLGYLRWRQSHGSCANCGSPSKFGYSHEPESKAEDIVKLCLTCLAAKMKDAYERYEGRALVIQPKAGFPCYVYQASGKWADSGIAKELDSMFSGTDKGCDRCGSKAHYFWVTSNERVESGGCRVIRAAKDPSEVGKCPPR